MNLHSHLRMASGVMKLYIRDQRFTERLAFLFGNIQPDLIGSFMFTPHSAAARGEAFEKKVKNCIDRLVYARHGGFFTSIRLGILCHFLADFFCYPHNEDVMSPRAHMGYEMAITKLLKGKGHMHAAVLRPACKTEEVLEKIWAAHNEYRTRPSNPERDIAYAVGMCAYLFGSADSIARLNRAEVLPLAEPVTA